MNHPSSLLATQLPMWPEPVRGGPNVLLRSALFAGIASKKRKILGTQTRPEKKPEGVIIAAQDGINAGCVIIGDDEMDAETVTMTGDALSQTQLAATAVTARYEYILIAGH